MKISSIWVALVLIVAGCVSDDQAVSYQTSAPTVTAAPSTSPTTEPSTTSTSQQMTSTTAGAQATLDALEPDQSAPKPRVTKRTQGAPITVTTVGAEVLGKTVVRSDVEVAKEWCDISEDGGLLALAEISNPGTLEGDFILEFEILDPLGVRVAEGLDVVHDIKAGQSFVARDAIADVVGWDSDPRAWTCQVLRLSTPEPVLN